MKNIVNQILFALFCLNINAQSIDYPFYDTNEEAMVITNINMTSSMTEVKIEYTPTNSSSMLINDKTYIEDIETLKKYYIQSFRDNELGEVYEVEKGKRYNIVLEFPPLPQIVTNINIKEPNDEEGWSAWYWNSIQLRGKSNDKSSYNFEQMKSFANNGSVEFQCILGDLYFEGNLVEQDFNKSYYWYKKAAIQGYSEAQFVIGLIHYSGEEIGKDFNKAYYWLEKAAKQEVANAQYLLSLMYLDGLGTTEDFTKSLYWLKKAADQGQSDAQYALGELCYDIGKTQEAISWWKKSAKQGNLEAQAMLN